MNIPSATPIVPVSPKLGSSLTALIGAERAFERIVERIREARDEIEIRMFIWRNDSVGVWIADELAAAADRGVRIRIRKDLLGSIHERAEENRRSFFPHRQPAHVWLLTQFLKRLYFRPVSPRVLIARSRPTANHRLLTHPLVTCQYRERLWDHSKCYVFDRETLILGGMNLEEKLTVGDVYGKQWRDYMVELRNRVLAEAFLAGQSVRVTLNGASARLILHPGDRYEPESAIRTEIISLLRKARTEVIMEMAYFGDALITAEIVKACRRGVAVKIVTSARANIQSNLNLHILRQILDETNNQARVHLSPKMIHSKIMLVDNRYVYLGSGNFNRSSIKCAEVGVVIDCDGTPGMLGEFRDSLQAAIAESKQVRSWADVRFRRFFSMTEQLLSSARI
ncbi:MAG: phosphatidylserine/phosphatidylglycerophosphate/cardiolipin synthase family protein [Acidobacteria bacterium]|nr:MAG: phosphatidylserine/phosphatidylglycerophosphate/cardiolipin synthase family protein [Acidobacteriota bacterium]